MNAVETPRLWRHWDLPENVTVECPRIHRIGLAMIKTAVEAGGNEPVIAIHASFPDESDPGEAPPPRDAWTRAYLGNSSGYDLLPAYDEKPVCVRLVEPFTLRPGSSATGWIFTHANAVILVEGQAVANIPLKPVFKTLFGDPTSGIICVFQESGFFAADEPDYATINDNPATIAHPIKVSNNSDSNFTVRELCVHGPHLSIFETDNQLSSETLVFSYNDSGVRMGIEAPGRNRGSALVKPQVSGEERAFQRSVQLLKTITRM